MENSRQGISEEELIGEIEVGLKEYQDIIEVSKAVYVNEDTLLVASEAIDRKISPSQIEVIVENSVGIIGSFLREIEVYQKFKDRLTLYTKYFPNSSNERIEEIKKEIDGNLIDTGNEELDEQTRDNYNGAETMPEIRRFLLLNHFRVTYKEYLQLKNTDNNPKL